ncbi:MAG: ribonuclease III [Lachnospiraceae bacterium]|nr:ribonuclease III [Lachnospiraceae bacterium]
MEEGMTEDLLSYYKRAMKLTGADVDTYSPLVLAYIGDAVYEVMVRTKVVDKGNVQVSKLHKSSSHLVCAQAQAHMSHLLKEQLRPQELAVFKRGRNAKSATSAKNASITDYRLATGFEALVGWLFLTEQFERLIELVSLGLEQLEGD